MGFFRDCPQKRVERADDAADAPLSFSLLLETKKKPGRHARARLRAQEGGGPQDDRRCGPGRQVRRTAKCETIDKGQKPRGPPTTRKTDNGKKPKPKKKTKRFFPPVKTTNNHNTTTNHKTKKTTPNTSGLIDFDDFSAAMAAKISARDPDEEIAKAFALFDESGRGKIGLKDLRRVARELGEALADGELQEMIDEADRDGELCGEGGEAGREGGRGLCFWPFAFFFRPWSFRARSFFYRRDKTRASAPSSKTKPTQTGDGEVDLEEFRRVSFCFVVHPPPAPTRRQAGATTHSSTLTTRRPSPRKKNARTNTRQIMKKTSLFS